MLKRSNNTTVADEKKSTWLTNSTYVPVEIQEYSGEEGKKEINYNDVLDSDSCEDSGRVAYKRHKEKKKHYKKIKKNKVMKHYLGQIPSIDDDKCPFKKMIFAEELPRDERPSAFFGDVRGNSYISQYGSIVDKHVPKYRSAKKITASSVVSERYYSILKKPIKERKYTPVPRKQCDSHCVCQQPFIPVPYDIIMTEPEQRSIDEQEMVNEVAAINETINKDPHNVAAWLSLVTVQVKANQMGVSNDVATSIVVERRLMVVERALSKNQSNLQLHLLKMQLGGEVWPVDKLHKEWNQLLFVWNTNIDVWRFYINQMSQKTLGFSVDRIVAIYLKCFTTFFNVMSGRMKTRTIDSRMVMSLCDLFSDYCDFLAQSGYSERAIASWQMVIEYNFFSRDGACPRPSGNILDDPMLQSLHSYWEMSLQHIGQPESLGWKDTVVPLTKCPLQSCVQQIVADIESDLFVTDLDEPHMWLSLEETRNRAWWVPHTDRETELEDPDRSVSFQLLQPSLITVHQPSNLVEGLSSAVVSRDAKRRLLLLFLDHMGVSLPRVSIKYGLSTAKIRHHQLRLCHSLGQLASAIETPRTSMAMFVNSCLTQLSGVMDNDWAVDITVLKLWHGVQTHLSNISWKEALTGIRQSAKSVLSCESGATILWISYAETLLELTQHPLFQSTDKATKTLLAEASKVVQALLQQISSPALSFTQRLSIVLLSIDLLAKQNPLQRRDISAHLHQGTCLLSEEYRLNNPQNTLSSMCLAMSEVTSMIIEVHPLPSHWHLAFHLRAVCQLLLQDIEPFTAWMQSECMQAVTELGSKSNWSEAFLYQLSQFLEMITEFLAWHGRCRELNAGAIIRSLLFPIARSLAQVQSNKDTQIVDVVFSPRLLQLCTGQRSLSCQKLSIRNFLWTIVGSSETDTTTAFNYVCHGSSLLLLDMELRRYAALTTMDTEVFSGRADRVRSTYNRLLALRCMHWRHRLSLWLSLLRFEANEGGTTCEERTKGVFYRAVTEMPAQKSLYLAVVGLVPGLVEEVTTLMKNNGVRLCAPLEEVKLLLRIRQSSRSKMTDDTVTTQ